MMYILLEKSDARIGEHITNYDAMGFTKSEAEAICWVNLNAEYRCYKYCPNKEVLDGRC